MAEHRAEVVGYNLFDRTVTLRYDTEADVRAVVGYAYAQQRESEPAHKTSDTGDVIKAGAGASVAGNAFPVHRASTPAGGSEEAGIDSLRVEDRKEYSSFQYADRKGETPEPHATNRLADPVATSAPFGEQRGSEPARGPELGGRYCDCGHHPSEHLRGVGACDAYNKSAEDCGCGVVEIDGRTLLEIEQRRQNPLSDYVPFSKRPRSIALEKVATAARAMLMANDERCLMTWNRGPLESALAVLDDQRCAEPLPASGERKCPACFADKPCPSHVCEHPGRAPVHASSKEEP